MFWLLEIQNLSKVQVFECCEMAMQYEQVKSCVCCWYEHKETLLEDLAGAKKRAKQKYGIELKFKISKS